ncbi:hypothetical protein [Streptomyces griseosporeus]|uniref:hypothetical protein n=1 Tax=Streptomyces griseosporeus TaxID=1910 RepID=UPI0036F91924
MNGTPQGQGTGTSSPVFSFDRVGDFLGLLLAVFVGALNVIGLTSEELTTVLRNEAPSASLVTAFLLFSLVAAMVSVLVASDYKIPMRVGIGIAGLALAVAPLSVVLFKIPKVTTDGWWNFALALSCFFFVAALAFLVVHWNISQRIPLQVITLFCSVVLVSTAVYAAARLETKSQLEATFPQLDAIVNEEGSGAEVSTTVSASKLSKGEKVGVLIRGIPRGISLAAKCGDACTEKCMQMLCGDGSKARDYQAGVCAHIASAGLEPDSAGAVEGQQVHTPFSVRAYQLIEVRATICERVSSAKPCDWGRKFALAFLGLPPPSPSPSPSPSPCQSHPGDAQTGSGCAPRPDP